MAVKEDKIDKLARMVAKGFANTATKEDLTDIRREMATKQEMANLRTELKGDMINLRNDIDIMLSRHIGTFRKDYDELAARVKRIDPVRSSARLLAVCDA